MPVVTVTATPTSSDHSPSLSPGAVAGIVIGTLLGGVLFIVLVLYLLRRYSRHKFTRVANPAHDDAAGAFDLRHAHSRKSKHFARHSQKPSISSEPLMSPASWPPIPATSRVLSPATPPRLDFILPDIGDSQHSSFDLGEIHQVFSSNSTTPTQRPSSVSSRPGLDNTPPHSRQTTGDGATSPPSTPKSQTLFLHRMLKSRAQASEAVSLAGQPSLDFSQSRSTTLDSSDVRADEERLLAEAERTALRDAEAAQKGEEMAVAEGQVGWEEMDSTESNYSQMSAPIDHTGFFSDSVSRQNSSSSMPRRKSSRKQARTPAPTVELSPVTEVPDVPRVPEGVSRILSTPANSSLDAQVSHETSSRPMSVDALPLLTSGNFGKDNTTGGSISSALGWGSGSSGRTSRYPSLAPSSIAQSLQSGPRSDTETDWHHPPSGLAGLSLLQIEPLRNPHSPVEEEPAQREVLPTPVRRARLREGTTSSIPEVERRDVMQGGIARIDVAL